VAVHGCGGVGLSAVMIASALGARVVAVDRSPAALALAGQVGAQVQLVAGDTDGAMAGPDASGDVVSRILEVTGGGAAVSLDAVGSPATAAASVRCLRPRGRHVQLGLLLGAQSTPPLPMDLVVARELSLHGSHGMPATQYPGLLSLVESGALRPDRLVGRVIGLEDAPAALAAMSEPAGTPGMTVVRVTDPG
jgi:alcohol dehydrogenase